jgi:hypothetical protein
MSPDYFQSRWSLLSTVITIVAIEGSPEFVPNCANGNWRAVGVSIVIMSLFRGTKSESGDSMPSFEKQRVELLKKNDLVGVFGARHASAAIAWFELAESSFLGMRLRATSSRSRTDLWQRRHPPSASERSLPQAALNGLCQGGAPPQRSTETNAFVETKRWPSRCAQ